MAHRQVKVAGPDGDPLMGPPPGEWVEMAHDPNMGPDMPPPMDDGWYASNPYG